MHTMPVTLKVHDISPEKSCGSTLGSLLFPDDKAQKRGNKLQETAASAEQVWTGCKVRNPHLSMTMTPRSAKAMGTDNARIVGLQVLGDIC